MERIKIDELEKLGSALKDQNTYAVQNKNLNQALKYDLEFKKVYQVVKKEKRCWMISYIMLNNRLRIAAKNESEKYFFKLMNNDLGETLENIHSQTEMTS